MGKPFIGRSDELLDFFSGFLVAVFYAKRTFHWDIESLELGDTLKLI